KLFVFLREQRHLLFDAAFQQELAATYRDSPLGQPPIPPAQLTLAVLLQAYTGVSDDEVIEATTMDCLDAEQPPFSKGTLVGFRARLLAAELDRRLIERTVELYTAAQGPRPAGSSARRWIAARCGAPAAWRTRITFWATPCARRWACWRRSRGGSWPQSLPRPVLSG